MSNTENQNVLSTFTWPFWKASTYAADNKIFLDKGLSLLFYDATNDEPLLEADVVKFFAKHNSFANDVDDVSFLWKGHLQYIKENFNNEAVRGKFLDITFEDYGVDEDYHEGEEYVRLFNTIPSTQSGFYIHIESFTIIRVFKGQFVKNTRKIAKLNNQIPLLKQSRESYVAILERVLTPLTQRARPSEPVALASTSAPVTWQENITREIERFLYKKGYYDRLIDLIQNIDSKHKMINLHTSFNSPRASPNANTIKKNGGAGEVHTETIIFTDKAGINSKRVSVHLLKTYLMCHKATWKNNFDDLPDAEILEKYEVEETFRIFFQVLFSNGKDLGQFTISKCNDAENASLIEKKGDQHPLTIVESTEKLSSPVYLAHYTSNKFKHNIQKVCNEIPKFDKLCDYEAEISKQCTNAFNLACRPTVNCNLLMASLPASLSKRKQQSSGFVENKRQRSDTCTNQEEEERDIMDEVDE